MFRVFAGSTALRFAGMGLGFLVGVQLARGLGAEGYGYYGLALSIISMLSIPAEFGLATLVTREVAAAHAQHRWGTIWTLLRWASTAMATIATTILLLTIAGWAAFGRELQAEVAYALAAGCLLIAVVPLTNLCGGALRALQFVLRGQVPEIILRPAMYCGLLFLAVGWLRIRLTPATAMLMQVTSAAFALAAAFLMLKSVLPPRHAHPPIAMHTSEWLRSALPLALTESMRAIQGNLSTLALGALAAPSVVGVFRVGASSALLLAMPVTVVHVVSGPVFSRLHASGENAELQRYLATTTLLTVMAILICVFPFVLFGESILGVLFGRDFGQANNIIQITSLGTAIGAAFGPGATLLNMTGHERLVTRTFAASMLILAVLTLSLVPNWGGEGAALANSISFIAWSAMMWRHSVVRLGVDSSLWGFVTRRSSHE